MQNGARAAFIVSRVLEHPGSLRVKCLFLVTTSVCRLLAFRRKETSSCPRPVAYCEFSLDFKDKKRLPSHFVLFLAVCVVPSPWAAAGEPEPRGLCDPGSDARHHCLFTSKRVLTTPPRMWVSVVNDTQENQEKTGKVGHAL